MMLGFGGVQIATVTRKKEKAGKLNITQNTIMGLKIKDRGTSPTMTLVVATNAVNLFLNKIALLVHTLT